MESKIILILVIIIFLLVADRLNFLNSVLGLLKNLKPKRKIYTQLNFLKTNIYSIEIKNNSVDPFYIDNIFIEYREGGFRNNIKSKIIDISIKLKIYYLFKKYDIHKFKDIYHGNYLNPFPFSIKSGEIKSFSDPGISNKTKLTLEIFNKKSKKIIKIRVHINSRMGKSYKSKWKKLKKITDV
jgi:hypothetical protein